MPVNKPLESNYPPHPAKAVRSVAMVISYVFHPALMPTLMMLALHQLLPSAFAGIGPETFGKLMLAVVANTFFFPTVSTLLIKAVGFIDSIHLRNTKDRIIPLIVSMIFYFWVDNVFANLPGVPLITHALTKGSFWGLVAIFMCNIFFKISMHTTAAGAALTILGILLFISPVNMTMPFFAALFFGGLVGASRILLGAHYPVEIWLGYLLGCTVQLAAYFYLFRF